VAKARQHVVVELGDQFEADAAGLVGVGEVEREAYLGRLVAQSRRRGQTDVSPGAHDGITTASPRLDNPPISRKITHPFQ
jgi:hypothetical protein